jgi:hypothetical protein
MVFEFNRKDEWLVLETVEYPMLRIYVDFSTTMPKIGHIEILEQCSPSVLANTLKEADFCLREYSKILCN